MTSNIVELEAPNWNDVCDALDKKKFFNDDEKSKSLLAQHCENKQSMILVYSFTYLIPELS